MRKLLHAYRSSPTLVKGSKGSEKLVKATKKAASMFPGGYQKGPELPKGMQKLLHAYKGSPTLVKGSKGFERLVKATKRVL